MIAPVAPKPCRTCGGSVRTYVAPLVPVPRQVQIAPPYVPASQQQVVLPGVNPPVNNNAGTVIER